MKRRDFLRTSAFVSTGLIFVPKRLVAQSVSVLTAPGAAAHCVKESCCWRLAAVALTPRAA
jgi:hypothetical protein